MFPGMNQSSGLADIKLTCTGEQGCGRLIINAKSGTEERDVLS
jgi:hypothetical protein